eukprot:9265232-Pyramimonas_sp.AAC.1
MNLSAAWEATKTIPHVTCISPYLLVGLVDVGSHARARLGPLAPPRRAPPRRRPSFRQLPDALEVLSA